MGGERESVVALRGAGSALLSAPADARGRRARVPARHGERTVRGGRSHSVRSERVARYTRDTFPEVMHKPRSSEESSARRRLAVGRHWRARRTARIPIRKQAYFTRFLATPQLPRIMSASDARARGGRGGAGAPATPHNAGAPAMHVLVHAHRPPSAARTSPPKSGSSDDDVRGVDGVYLGDEPEAGAVGPCAWTTGGVRARAPD